MDVHITLLTLGGLFAIGLATDAIARRFHLPRVTLLILFGVLAGPGIFNIIPGQVDGWYDLLATTALTMVAFLLGGSLTKDQMLAHGRQIMAISISVVIVTILLVSAGFILAGFDPALALVLAGIAAATDPAAIRDVIRQYGYKGSFSDTLKGIVAIDDLWGLLAFSFLLVGVNALGGNGTTDVLLEGLWELGGAIAVGAGIGLPAAYLTGRLKEGEPMQIEALAVVFLCAGLSVWLGVSFLLAGVVAGMIVVNFASHHTYPFHEIENIEGPFMMLFFVLAGASLEMEHWQEFGFLIMAFVFLRTLSRIIGGWIGARIGKAPASYGHWMGTAMLPQAGVAVGMALVAGNKLPDYREVILSVTIMTTILFEVFGPLVTQIALSKADSPSETSQTDEGTG
ncbi:cation:proton antiporter [Sneathiella chinensis]|uniref:Cation/H+ exchanger transmembrane domain-containing protein n=1 Tax=Sneathiella chinensis TaxID=349750 RepID=A0ABQ5U266_9PROT|nr:cation:proton antiporter [Sneathiella chinensis]GLQ05933.1 hypothetical protein GCM10007924_11540 [Sneathiella chinensis]